MFSKGDLFFFLYEEPFTGDHYKMHYKVVIHRKNGHSIFVMNYIMIESMLSNYDMEIYQTTI